MLYVAFLIFLNLFNFALLHTTADVRAKLITYGFLTPSEVTADETRTALLKYQKTNNLPQTGIADKKTWKHLNRPRCGISKNKVTFNFNDYKWYKHQLTYQVFNIPAQYDVSTVTSFIEDAMTDWTRNLNLQISRSTTNASDINIHFLEQDGPGAYLGFAWKPENSTVYLDKDEDWVFEKYHLENEVYFGWIIGHELGHSLGLTHSDNPDSIMYRYYSHEVYEPSSLDRKALEKLYKVKVDKSEICENPKIDAIDRISTNRYLVFKNTHFWIMSAEGIVEGPFDNQGYLNVSSSIDCAFSIGKFFLAFKDDMYYRIDTGKKISKEKIISEGFPNLLLSNIDATFYNPNNGIIYFFKDEEFYEYYLNNSINERLLGKSMKISKRWPGIPDNIDAVTMLEDNVMLFVKAAKCYSFYLNNSTVVKKDCRDFYKC